MTGNRGGNGGTGSRCGDGITQPSAEQCDDGNATLCDGCESCELRHYLSLDGTTGTYIRFDDAPGKPLQLLDSRLTVEGWFRVDADGDIIDVKRRGTENTGWKLLLHKTGVTGTVFGVFDHSLTLAPTGWHHLAWTFDGSTSTIFVDGHLASTESHAASIEATDKPVVIGLSTGLDGEITGYTSGKLDEVRVSSVIRYTESFTPARRHEPDVFTVALWHFDEGEGAAIVDASDNEHVGHVSGSVRWGTDNGYDGLFCP